jgi:hypothetical protein
LDDAIQLRREVIVTGSWIRRDSHYFYTVNELVWRRGAERVGGEHGNGYAALDQTSRQGSDITLHPSELR